jgi:hypothetical protein
MAKKSINLNIKSSPFVNILKNIPIENVNLLYFLFLLAILHLGYFIMKKETVLLISFCIAAISVYLVNPNMVIVLGASLLFVDVLYAVRTVPEGFDSSGNKTGSTKEKKSSKEKDSKKDKGSTKKESSLNPFNNEDEDDDELSYKDSDSNENFENRDAVNPIVSVPIKEKMTGNDLEEIDKQTQTVQSLVEKIKNTSPEIAESLKLLNSIDINELNKLINNLNGMVGSFKFSA